MKLGDGEKMCVNMTSVHVDMQLQTYIHTFCMQILRLVTLCPLIMFADNTHWIVKPNMYGEQVEKRLHRIYFCRKKASVTHC